MKNINVGITVGDINGIGIEVIIKTLRDKRILDSCTPIIFGSNKLFKINKKNLDLKDFNLNVTNNINHVKKNKINLVTCLGEDVEVVFGKQSVKSGEYAFKSLKIACNALDNKKIDVLVTAPINKDSIQKKIKSFIGHTEFLEDTFEGKSLMLMVSQEMKIAFATGHIPLSNVNKSLSKSLIIDKTRQFNSTLTSDFKIIRPKIAILGINPHAGENGLLGTEENKIIIPAINELNKKNILAFGPYPADSFFTYKNLSFFDGILSMYHDQGLIPFKTLSFFEGVNYTSGLNIIRTSPVHGTGFDIAGKNLANETSFREAIFLACNIYNNRTKFQQLQKSSLIEKDNKMNK